MTSINLFMLSKPKEDTWPILDLQGLNEFPRVKKFWMESMVIALLHQGSSWCQSIARMCTNPTHPNFLASPMISVTSQWRITTILLGHCLTDVHSPQSVYQAVGSGLLGTWGISGVEYMCCFSESNWPRSWSKMSSRQCRSWKCLVGGLTCSSWPGFQPSVWSA